jgi:nucleotide-binding universal stress UspA family protein
MFNKILVAIDYSERSNYVFDAALSLAKANKANLMLLNVISDTEEDYPQLPTYSYYPILDDRTAEIYHQKLEEYKQARLDLLRSLTEIATEADVPTEFSQISGNPGRILCDMAENWQADLIVVGSRGLTGIKEMFLGSVSNYVTHHASCSVLIVHTPVKTDSESSPENSAELATS